MNDVKKRFTKWYIRKGYRFYYKVRFNGDTPKAKWLCAWYIRPLLIFFSPSVYFYDVYSKVIAERILKELEEAKHGEEKDS